MTHNPTATATDTDDHTGTPAPKSSDCPVCPHPMADHDAIGTRFCAAKIAGGSADGCACRR
ncbi:RGCVC family protein [Pseudonocardia parietis]|uniref:Uncharacterized protein n=1 Tax=Pseudonocardia parietis TaxID=570936 RepID=A0ABS4VMY6_9PSEU|nr:RGCVC family protein [Pseudonocardia parietis]MBP2365295.1 hypothetical protein [Pseudonocardia parietis]